MSCEICGDVRWEFMCPYDASMCNAGFVALVEHDPSQGSPGNEFRTGKISHLSRAAWSRAFTEPEPSGHMCFVEPGMIEKLEQMERSEH